MRVHCFFLLFLSSLLEFSLCSSSSRTRCILLLFFLFSLCFDFELRKNNSRHVWKWWCCSRKYVHRVLKNASMFQKRVFNVSVHAIILLSLHELILWKSAIIKYSPLEIEVSPWYICYFQVPLSPTDEGKLIHGSTITSNMITMSPKQ